MDKLRIVKSNSAPPFAIPSGIPASIRTYILQCVNHNLEDREWQIIKNIALNVRVQKQWLFLTSKRDNGELLYPAAREPGSQNEAQQRAMGYLFH
jgi:hypothetical protein